MSKSQSPLTCVCRDSVWIPDLCVVDLSGLLEFGITGVSTSWMIFSYYTYCINSHMYRVIYNTTCIILRCVYWHENFYININFIRFLYGYIILIGYIIECTNILIRVFLVLVFFILCWFYLGVSELYHLSSFKYRILYWSEWYKF